MNKFNLIIATFIFSIYSVWPQNYKEMIALGTYTVYEIQQEAEAYFDSLSREKGTGYFPYKRWEYIALRTQDESGMLKAPDFYYYELERYNNYRNQNPSNFTETQIGNWEELGPSYYNATSGWNPGVGRITSIAIDESNTDHIIVGGHTGGVWKTTDEGVNWTVLTDNLSNLNVYSLTMDPTNSSIYYWGSSQGTILKSTDSGSTWNILANVGFGYVNKILIDPNNTNKMYCSVEYSGIYKSTDGGNNWQSISPSETTGYDIEFKPGDTNTIYASGYSFLKSTDGGNTFNNIVGVFNSGAKMIGVTANDPSAVYVLEESGGTFGGLYKSTDSGSNFTELDHTGLNYFGYSSSANDTRGQAPRDMDIVVNPLDVNDIHIAGINTWRSTDGGISFNITSQWVPGNASGLNIGYCHADVDIMLFINNKLYLGTDGGIFVADDPTTVNSTYYRDLTDGLGIRQFYKIGISQSTPSIVTGGCQDNGTSVIDASGNWTDWLGADGMESFVDKDDNSILYGTTQYGSLYKSTNSGNSSFSLPKPENKSGNWITPFEQDPTLQDVIYSGYDEVYKSVDGGFNWISISQNFGSNLDHIKIAPSDNLTLYASLFGQLYKTTNGGVGSWVSLTGFSGNINYIAIHPTNPNRVAIATNGSQKVYVSTDGGATWTSYLNDLPNFSALALAWQDNGNNGLYIGMDYGVYYIDDTYTNWQPFNTNLPNVIVNELEINTITNKIYAGSYGRGLWRSDLFDAALSTKKSNLNDIVLYPNPVSDELKLSWNRNDDLNISIFNSLGKMVYKNKIKVFKNIDVSKLNSGIYFVRLSNASGTITKKLIVNGGNN